MESLDKQWILHGNIQQCEQFEKTPNTLGLKNMAGVFILVGAGIIGGICLIIIEVVYKKHQIKKQKRMEIARHAADKWRGTIEVNVCRYCYQFEIDFCFFCHSETKNVTSFTSHATTIQCWIECQSGYNKSGSG